MSLNQNNVTHHPKRLTIGPRASFESSYEMEWNDCKEIEWNVFIEEKGMEKN